MTGRVSLIGAGPGDPGLLTLRGAELLAQSDVVLFDGLSNRRLLRHAPQAEHVCVGKHGQSRIWQQSEIIAEMLLQARQGRHVSRLKGGDPAVFARTAEEVAALREARIPFEIVPGITAALAASSAAGIPVTHRRLASAVALVTGHEEPEKGESAIDWSALAKFPGTLVIYMGVTTVESWTTALLAAGKPRDTPVAIIRRCSLADQQTVRCRLDEVAGYLTPASQFRPPVITIIGPVANEDYSPMRSSDLPLVGQTILVTRPVNQAGAFADKLRQRGAHVVIQPAIEIGPPDDWSPIDAAIRAIQQYDALVFCSQNGVDSFLGRFGTLDVDIRKLADCQIAVVGSKTAAALARFHLQPDLIPKDFRAEALAEQMAPQIAGKRVLIVRASRGRDLLAGALRAAGGQIEQVAAYSHRDVTTADRAVLQMAAEGRIQWVTLTSSATAQSVAKLFGEAMQNMKIASLSPVTSQTVRELGFTVDAEAEPYTIDALVEAIERKMP